MLPVKTKCPCGAAAQLTRTGDGRWGFEYHVTCRACHRSSRNWQTMTVAIIDWEDDIRGEKSDNLAS